MYQLRWVSPKIWYPLTHQWSAEPPKRSFNWLVRLHVISIFKSVFIFWIRQDCLVKTLNVFSNWFVVSVMITGLNQSYCFILRPFWFRAAFYSFLKNFRFAFLFTRCWVSQLLGIFLSVVFTVLFFCVMPFYVCRSVLFLNGSSWITLLFLYKR